MLPDSVDDLVKELAGPNRTRRNLAQDRLTDRFGTTAAAALQRAVDQPVNSFQHVYALWGLERLGELKPNALGSASQSEDAMVRVHAQRIASRIWEDDVRGGPMIDIHRIAAAHEVMTRGMKDKDAFVQRCAVEALANHNLNASSNVRQLLDLRAQVPTQDTHLIYSVRRALCDQLQRKHVFEKVLADNWTETESRALADVTPAVTNTSAAAFLVAHLQKYSETREVAAKYLKHAARFLPKERIDDLASLAQDKFRDDVDLQSALFKSVQDGLAQRGVALSVRMKSWGSALAADLLAVVARTDSDWTSMPVDSNSTGPNPWAVQRRKSSDGKDADFLCTLPAGEQMTGVLRSKKFTAPAKLTFWMAGHDGFPEKPLQKKNLVRLRNADSLEVLLTASAPRNDVAKEVSWNLGAHAGKAVLLELVDGDTAGAYAWLAVGRFQPPVVTLPKTTPKLVDERLQSAAQITLATREASLAPQLVAALKSPAGADARASVAATLLALNVKQHLAACGEIMNDAGAPETLRQKIAQAIAESNSDEGRALVVDVLRRVPERAQPKFALALATSKPSAEALLKEVESGRVSARLLQNQSLKEKLLAAKPDKVSARIDTLTKNLTPLNEQLQKVIDQRARAFNATKASATAGFAVFEKNCAACHQLDGKGAIVGPQLDGLGARGAERIMEDILDPNRNVDGAFRATLFELKDGDVVSGLFRREEGELVIYAESTGKELSVAKKNIKERRQSELSLMPENFGETIPANEFNDLIAFLLTKTGNHK